MKLATIILPIVTSEGLDLFWHHQQLKHDLLLTWKGYTATKGDGAWLPPEGGLPEAEEVMVYQVAMCRADTAKFRVLAADVARRAGQKCVMIVTPNGDVEFVEPS